MKRKIALLILVIVALSLALAACNTPDATSVIPRWDNGEQYTFRISMADFEGKNTLDNTEAHKDVALSGENLAAADQVEPTNVTGTYTISIEKQGTDQWKFSTVQDVWSLYNVTEQQGKLSVEAQDGTRVELSDELKQKAENDAQGAADKFADAQAQSVVLHSLTATWVIFEDKAKQHPISSHTEADGYYLGKAHQELNKYTLDTQYVYEKDEDPVAKVTLTHNVSTDEESAAEESVELYEDTIDSAQLLLYLRSLDKSANSFQDNPAVRVFDPFTKKISVANFQLQKLVLMRLTRVTDSAPQVKNAKVNVASVYIDGMPLLAEEDIPAEANIPSERKDAIDAGGEIVKFTTIRFRVGYLAYEIEYPESKWDGLKPNYEQPAEE